MAAPVPLHADRGDGRTYTAPARRPTGQTSTHGRLTIGHFKLQLDLHHLDGRDPSILSGIPPRIVAETERRNYLLKLAGQETSFYPLITMPNQWLVYFHYAA